MFVANKQFFNLFLLIQDVLEEKVAQLSAWAQRKHVIKLSSAKFMTYVK